MLSLVAFLSGCQKEILSPTQISKLEPRTPTIKIDEVKEWYQRAKATFDREKNLRSGGTSLDGVVPDWNYFKNSYNTIGQEFGVLPLNFMVGSKGFARLLINRDSIGNLVGKYAIYLPDSMYRLTNRGNYSPQTFTGLIFYFNSDGSFSYGYEYVNGTKTRAASIIDKNRAITLRDCWTASFTVTILYQAGAYSEDIPRNGVETTTYSVTICSDWGGQGGSIGNGTETGGGGNTDPSDAFLGMGIDGLASVLDGEGNLNLLKQNFSNQVQFIDNIISLNSKLGGAIGRSMLSYDLINLFYTNPELMSLFSSLNTSETILAFNSLKKYTNAGFSGNEFARLYADATLFQEIDEVANTEGISTQFKEDVKLYQNLLTESAGFNEFCNNINALNAAGGGNPLWDIAVDLMLDAAQEWAGSLLGLDDLQELRQLLSQITPDGFKKIGFKCTRVIARFIGKKNPVFNALNSMWKAKEIYNKLMPAYNAYKKLGSLSADVMQKLSQALKNTGGNLMKRFVDSHDGSSTLSGHFDISINGTSLNNFLDKIGEAFGTTWQNVGTPTNPAKILNLSSFGISNCVFYPTSTTPPHYPTIQITLNNGQVFKFRIYDF